MCFIGFASPGLYRDEINDRMDTILRYDADGQLAFLDILCCADGVSIKHFPEEVQEQVKQEALVLGIVVKDR